MKAAFACLLLLAGSAYCTPVESKILPDWLEIPKYVPDWWPIEIEKPDWWPESIPPHPEWITWPPKLPEWWPDSIPPHPEWITWPPTRPDWWPEDGIDWGAIEWPEKPEWWPEKPEWWPEIDWDAIEKPDWWPEIDWDEIERPEINKAVRGTVAAIEEFPGIVQIEIGSGIFWIQGCVGSVLTSAHILTSARCMSGRDFNPRFRRIRAGRSKRFEGIVFEIGSVVTHPSFGDTSENFFDGDMAIARPTISMTLGPTIQQTPIVPAGFSMPAGVGVTLSGWGSTAQGRKIANRDLHKIELTSIDQDTCSEVWSTLIPYETIKVTSNMICVGRSETGGRDADLRDIGAPIYINNILVGVTSWGNYLGNQRFPLVATAVSSYTDWIVSNAV